MLGQIRLDCCPFPSGVAVAVASLEIKLQDSLPGRHLLLGFPLA